MEPLTVAGSLDSLSAIRAYVDRAAAEAGLDRRATYRLRLAVDEIATNIVNYGYERAHLRGDILVRATLDDAWLTVALEDSGLPYDPTAHAAPSNLDDPLEERPIGGLGIFLTQIGVDDFRYEHRDGHNVNAFAMRRPGPEGSP
jgi:serine/threonine-protein kinase RsbW